MAWAGSGPKLCKPGVLWRALYDPRPGNGQVLWSDVIVLCGLRMVLDVGGVWVFGLFAFKGVGGVGIRRSGGGSVGGSFGG